MLKPVIVLILWTLIVLVWLYAKRIPAMQKAKIKPDDYKLSHQKKGNPLPNDAVAVADNYNPVSYTHLDVYKRQGERFRPNALLRDMAAKNEGFYQKYGQLKRAA